MQRISKYGDIQNNNLPPDEQPNQHILNAFLRYRIRE